MPNLNAALGCAQLEQLPGLLLSKRELFNQFRAAFFDVPGVKVMAEPERCKSNYWLQTLIFDVENLACRDAVLQATNSAGFMTRPVWTLMDEMTMFSNCPSMCLENAKSLAARVINIPSSAGLAEAL